MIVSNNSETENLFERAKEARVSGLPLKGARLLHTIVTSTQNPAHSAHIAEYAACLLELGAARTAIHWLSQERPDWPPLRYFVLAMAHFELWSIEEAVQLLKMYLASHSVDPVLAGKARTTLAYCYGLKTDYFDVKRMPRLSAPDPEFARLNEIYKGLRTSDPALLKRAYFGTPSSQLRSQILYKTGLSPLGLSDYVVTTERNECHRIFDLYKGVEQGNPQVFLKLGQAPHVFLVTLLRDFYKPVSVAKAFESLFPQEYFHPFQSAARVHQISRRLRLWFKKHEIPTKIVEHKGTYSLKLVGPYGILLNEEHLNFQSIDPLYLRLMNALPSSEFSTPMAARALGVSDRFALTVIKRGRKKGWITTEGKGKNTRHAFRPTSIQ